MHDASCLTLDHPWLACLVDADQTRYETGHKCMILSLRWGCTGAAGYEQQQLAAAWRAYLAWECNNPQKLTPPELATRVSLAYDQALMPLRFYPDVRFFSPSCQSDCHHAAFKAPPLPLFRNSNLVTRVLLPVPVPARPHPTSDCYLAACQPPFSATTLKQQSIGVNFSH